MRIGNRGNLRYNLNDFGPYSLMDRIAVCGTVDPGPIPGGGTSNKKLEDSPNGMAPRSKRDARKGLGVQLPHPPQRNKSPSDLNAAVTFKFLSEIYYVPHFDKLSV